MVATSRKRRRAAEPPEMVRLEFPRKVVSGLAARLQEHAGRQTDQALRAWLFSAAAKFDGFCATPGEPVVCESTPGNWYKLAAECLRFKSGGFGAALARRLGEMQFGESGEEGDA